MPDTPNTLPAKAKIDLPVALREQMKQEAADIIANRVMAPSGNRIAVTQAKSFKLPDGTEVRDSLDLIVVDFVAAQFWYKDAFDREQISPPMCFALGTDPKRLTPSANALMPQSEGKECKDCWAFQWKSDRNGGRGKDCSSNFVLATLFPDFTPESPLNIVRVSASGTKYWNAYAALLSKLYDTPPYGFLTKLIFDPSVTYSSLRFIDPRPLDAETIEQVMGFRDEARKILLTEPDTSQAKLEMAQAKSERANLQAPRTPARRPTR